MRSPVLFFLIAATLFLSGCLYDSAPSQPASQIDTWLLGEWMAQDKSGKIFEATVSPQDSTHYRVILCNKDKNELRPWEFEGWISRVGNLKFLTLRSLSEDPRYRGKYLFLHYELMTPEKAPINDVGARRMSLSEPQLPESTRTMDSYHLRQAIKTALKQGTLLVPQGASIWTKTGTVTWPRSLPSP